MTDDLPARILGAIEETERIARAATPGPWFTPGEDTIAEWSVYGDGWMIASTHHYPRSDMRNEAVKLRKPATVVEHGNVNAAHIARQDPQATLLRCEADREILAEYYAASAELVSVRSGRQDPEQLAEAEGARNALKLVVRLLAHAYGVEVTA